jgi:hypothetical protein
MWVTNGLMSDMVFVLVKTDGDAKPRHKGFTCFIAEKEGGVSENTGDYAGLTVPPKIKKMGYKGVESTELVFDGYKCPAENILGGEEAGLNKGFAQMMDALEVGRANVAARGVGLAQRALELAIKYSSERKTFGKPINQHQVILFKLADMATQIDAARLMVRRASMMKDAGERSDMEAGMAKLFASETARFCAEECLRIHGGYGYSKEYEIERIYRDAPLLLIGEGTSEIQRMVIGKKLLARFRRGWCGARRWRCCAPHFSIPSKCGVCAAPPTPHAAMTRKPGPKRSACAGISAGTLVAGSWGSGVRFGSGRWDALKAHSASRRDGGMRRRKGVPPPAQPPAPGRYISHHEHRRTEVDCPGRELGA